GKGHAMAGLLPVTTSFAAPKRHLGYRGLKSLEPSPLGPAGTTFRGHEFHYAAIVDDGARHGDTAPIFDACDAGGRSLGSAGHRRGSVAGSFMHLIDRIAEASDADFQSRHIRIVEE
ncbi:MAG: hypothetical protein ACR2Q4_19480, partial [Geminicoccaceae bacterium]